MTVEAQANPQGAEAQPSPEDRLARLFGEKQAQEAKADPEPEQVTEESEAETAAPEADEGQADEAEASTEAASEDTAATDEETADIEIDGETYVVPKKLEGAFLKERDYRQKTAEVAEKRRALDERERFIGEIEQIRSAVFEKAAEAKALEKQLARYETLDWRSLASSMEPAEFNRLRFEYDDLQRQHATVQGEVRSIVAEQQQLSAKQRQQLVAKGNEELAREIKGWNEDTARKLLSSSKHYGFSDDELAAVNDPRYVRVLHDAHQWRELQKSKNTIVNKKIAQAKPITVKAARSSPATQQAGLVDAARAQARKTGKPQHAEEALYRLFESKRKR